MKLKSQIGIYIIFILILFSEKLKGQQWSGLNTLDATISRSGNIELNRNVFGVAQLTISNTAENPGNYSSYWKGDGVTNIDSQTRLLLKNPNAGTGFTNGLYIGLDQAFAQKSYTIGTKDVTPLTFYTSGKERMVINSAGNIVVNRGEFGISELQIINTAENPGNYSSYWSNGTGGNIDSQTRLLLKNPNAGIGFTNGLYIGLDQAFSLKSYTIGSKDATPLCFFTDGTEKIRISADGKVGIGTGTPDSKLTVAGDIHSREVKVTINAGSDFVFQNDYKLRTLNEVAKFIAENKHLPDIESAKEMEEKGLELGKMDMKLLQKIEELTLYIIDFKKEMDKMKEENEKLKEDIIELKKK